MASRKTINRVRNIVKLGNFQAMALLLSMPILAVTLLICVIHADTGAAITLGILGFAFLVFWMIMYRPLIYQIRFGRSILKDLEEMEGEHLMLEDYQEANNGKA